MLISREEKLYGVLLRWFVIIGLAAALLGLLIYSFLIYLSVREYVYQSLTNSRDQQAILIQNWINEKQHVISQLSLTPVVRKKETAEIKRMFTEYLAKSHTEFRTFLFSDIFGNVLVDAVDYNPVQYVGDRSYFQAGMQGKSHISEVIFSRKDNTPIIVFSSPVFSEDNRVIGVVSGGLSLDKLDAFVSSFNFGKTGETFLVDKNGLMLTESRFTPLLVDRKLVKETTKFNFRAASPGVTRAISGETGYREYLNYRDAKVLAAYCWLPEREWGLVIEVEKAEILGDLLKRMSVIIAALILCTALAITPLAKKIVAGIVEPLHNLTERLARFTDNYKSNVFSWSVLDANSYEEISRLNRAFYTMGEKLSQLMENLEFQARYDLLTGLPNRKHFYRLGQQVIDLIQRNGRYCSLIFLDIDKFKRINDTYGHSAGDAVLAMLGGILEKNMRISDVVGRFGGEEFTILLPDTGLEGAKLVAERLRKIIAATPVPVNGGKEVFITVSMGIAVYYGTKVQINREEVLETLINKADTAMYRAKEQGNRVEIYHEDDRDNQLKLFLDEPDDVM